MKDTEFYERLLGLAKPWKVKDVVMDVAGGEVHVEVECEATIWAGDEGQRLHIHGHEQRRWRHLDTCQLRTIIAARVPRVMDPQSGKTQMVQVPWAGPRSGWTLMFEHFAIRVLLASATISEGVKLLGLNWHQSQQIMERAVERGLQRREAKATKYLGFDEKSFRKGQDYISVMTDLVHECVLEVVPGRDTAAVLRLWSTLPPNILSEVEAAAMDFGAAYAAGARIAAAHVKVVYDKFHVSKLLSESVDQVRRAEHKALSGQGDETLKHSRWLWLKGLESMSEGQFLSFQQLAQLALKTARAWEIKELFGGFWAQRSVKAAAAHFTKWYGRVMRSRLTAMKKTARTLRQHIEGLLNYILHPITNALTEGLNSRIQLLRASARGFRNFEHYRIRILFFLGKLDLLPPLNQSHGS